ncbi:MAG: ABC transporter permease [Proteobacteria bacterium]|nr:ABC transporter permease [Pseudomonadota bacterium]
MPIKFVVLWSDALIYVLFAAISLFIFWARRKYHLRNSWKQVFSKPLAMISIVFLVVYSGIAFLDSIHFQPKTEKFAIESVLDQILAPLNTFYEVTYSKPFALHSYAKDIMTLSDGSVVRDYPKLSYSDLGQISIEERRAHMIDRTLNGAQYGAAAWIILSLLIFSYLSYRWKTNIFISLKKIFCHETELPWLAFFITLGIVLISMTVSWNLSQEFHIFGTDKVGQDVFYEAVKSIRTGLIIGTLTTLLMLPFAIFLGIAAGYFGGKIDDFIQYVYTTLSSIPGVLLIAAAVLSLQIFIANHSQWFETLTQRADDRLLALCAILGITSWTALCRILRGETLKLREMDYIQAARALGVGKLRIISRHILPNVMHIVLIGVVLDFSSLVLAEAVLSYVGVGVDPTTLSWGNMINAARLELAREPLVWWPLLAAFIFMFILVLFANVFSDAVRDGFDPRIRKL